MRKINYKEVGGAHVVWRKNLVTQVGVKKCLVCIFALVQYMLNRPNLKA